MGVVLVEHDDAGGDAGAVKEVGRQADDALDGAPADDLAADGRLGPAPEEDAVRENHAPLPVLFRQARMCSRNA